MSVAVETFGFFLGVLGLLMLGVTLPNGYWRVSSIHGNVITTSTIFENLWYSCATDSTGVYNCWEFPSMLALSGTIQACRALMITAILFGFLGLFVGIVGLRCTQVGSLTLESKAKLAATAGALDIVAGICGMVTISWYASNITREFFDPLYSGTNVPYKAPLTVLPTVSPTSRLPPGASDNSEASFGKYGKNAYV
ncbi:claudin-15 isoform X2 [Notamacropus eugenii]|uniref:claudin-15 isoform X2 n=1 Tax=Notamacropus eugenii TaxID=9315 RepID=UPI003B674BFC